MASDRQQFERALEAWTDLSHERLLSVPVERGATGILVGHYTENYYLEADYRPDLVQSRFDLEARLLAAKLRKLGRASTVIIDAQPADFVNVLQDPEITDVVTVGNGNLTALFLDTEDDRSVFGWKDVLENVTHLKTGTFIQRHCGVYDRSLLPVPLGLFAMASHDAVFAPVGQFFQPESLNDTGENRKIRQVFTDGRIAYDAVSRLRKRLTSDEIQA